MPDQTNHRTILITGAAGGIGRATVALFAEKGWQVIGVDRAEFGADFPSNGLFIQSDVSIGANMETIFKQARAFSDRLHALVNNAALQVARPLLETSVEDWDAVMASNLRSVFLGIKLAHPLLKAAGGAAIVNVSSVHAVATSANIAAYAASKGGLLALTRAVAIEFAGDNIRCNAPDWDAGTSMGATSCNVWTTWRARRSTVASAGRKRSLIRSISWRMRANLPS